MFLKSRLRVLLKVLPPSMTPMKMFLEAIHHDFFPETCILINSITSTTKPPEFSSFLRVCPSKLLLSLFQKFEFNRLSMILRGGSPAIPQANGLGNGNCKCEECAGGQICGYSALEFETDYWQYEGSTYDPEKRLEVTGNDRQFAIHGGGRWVLFSVGLYRINFASRKETFNLVPRSLQLFRFPSSRLEHTDHAFDALICHWAKKDFELASIPIDYIINLASVIFIQWQWVISVCNNFLNNFVSFYDFWPLRNGLIRH